MRFIGVLMVFAACQSGGTVAPDTRDGTDDGSQRGPGMFVSWHADPALPGPLSDKLIVSEVTFQLNHFQLVADSGNSARTKYLLAWSAGVAPPQEKFPDATPGVYSKASLDLGGTLVAFSYRIRGIWSDGRGAKSYTIEDDMPASVMVDCNKTLTAAASAEIAIKIDLRDPLGTISFKDLEDDEDDTIVINNGNRAGELQIFRARLLQHAFKSED